MRKFFIVTWLLGYFVTRLLLPKPVLAVAPGCDYIGTAPSLGCLADTIVVVINFALAFLGATTVLFLLYGSIRFIVSRGDPKAIESAKNTITYAIIGAVVVLSSFIIINAAFSLLGLPSPLQNFSLFVGPEYNPRPKTSP